MGIQPLKLPGGANVTRPNLPPPLHNRQRNHQQRQQQHFQHQQQQHQLPPVPLSHALPPHPPPPHTHPSHLHAPQPYPHSQHLQPPHQHHLPPPPPSLPPPPLPPTNNMNHPLPPPPDTSSRMWNAHPAGPYPPHFQNQYRLAPAYGGEQSRTQNSFPNGRGQMPVNPYRGQPQSLPDRPAHLPARPSGLPPRPEFNSTAAKPAPRVPVHNVPQHQRYPNGNSNGGGLNYG